MFIGTRLARGRQSFVDPTWLENRAWPLGFDQRLQTDCGLSLVAWVYLSDCAPVRNPQKL